MSGTTLMTNPPGVLMDDPGKRDDNGGCRPRLKSPGPATGHERHPARFSAITSCRSSRGCGLGGQHHCLATKVTLPLMASQPITLLTLAYSPARTPPQPNPTQRHTDSRFLTRHRSLGVWSGIYPGSQTPVGCIDGASRFFLFPIQSI